MNRAFIGRKNELAALERAYHQPSASFMPVYGRRRVGKTELLLQFCRNKPHIYYVATQGTTAHQVRTFLRAAADGLGQTWLAEAAPDEWQKALQLVLEVPPRNGNQRLILVLDEFQWLCESSPELPSILQRLWDLHWQRDPRLMLILCGSYVGFMEREVLGSKSPLFGRRTGQILVEPFPFYEAADFYPHWSKENCARAYFICGGIPYYLNTFDPAKSVNQNLMTSFLATDAPLFREPDFLLREELREVGTYTTLIEAIAEGKNTYTAMAAFAGVSTNQLPYFLNNLLALGYIQKRLPLAPGSPSRKQTRYAIAHPLLRFWFRFIAPNYSMIRASRPERAFETLVQPSLESFYGYGFEALCREALPYLYRSENFPGKFSVGEFWNAETQIDVVGLRADGWIDLGECKWGETQGLAAMLKELSTKAAHYPLNGSTLQKRLFTRFPFKSTPPPAVRLHDLKSLYEAAMMAS